jgi:diaminohydroxyphosphoribosylaminopyrimidine deaminase/5-amino-6-(5-phosphoribosylamino)uracil reductase
MLANDYMKMVLSLAQKALGATSPNPMVGALVVKNGKILATGYHHYCGGDHAEIDALKKVRFKASGATLYINLEPCHHCGRTPPCVDKIIESGIKEVVIAMKDPNPLTNGKSIRKLQSKGIRVRVGILEKEAEQLNEVFIKYIKTGMPFIVAKSAQTLDGKIATQTGDSKWITSEATRQYARQRRDQFDAILVGINTVLKDNPKLSGIKKNIKKIILDSNLKLSLGAILFKNTKSSQCIVATTKKAPLRKINEFKKRGVEVMICPSQGTGINLKWLVKELAKKEIASILIEGGAQTIGSALKDQLVDKMHIYIAPKILGDVKAKNSIEGINIKQIDQTIKLSNLSVTHIGEDLFLEGYVYRHR